MGVCKCQKSKDLYGTTRTVLNIETHEKMRGKIEGTCGSQICECGRM